METRDASTSLRTQRCGSSSKRTLGGKKFDFEVKANSICFSIEKTERERLVAKRTGYLIKALTDHLVESQKITIKEAQKSLDGEYVRGYVMFLAPPYETKLRQYQHHHRASKVPDANLR